MYFKELPHPPLACGGYCLHVTSGGKIILKGGFRGRKNISRKYTPLIFLLKIFSISV